MLWLPHYIVVLCQTILYSCINCSLVKHQWAIYAWVSALTLFLRKIFFFVISIILSIMYEKGGKKTVKGEHTEWIELKYGIRVLFGRDKCIRNWAELCYWKEKCVNIYRVNRELLSAITELLAFLFDSLWPFIWEPIFLPVGK